MVHSYKTEKLGKLKCGEEEEEKDRKEQAKEEHEGRSERNKIS